MARAAANPLKSPAYVIGGWMLFIAAAVIIAALGFEHLGGYTPCPLCLQQRYAYYAGIPLMFLALVLLSAEQPKWSALVFIIVSLGFLANAGLGVYQAGAEYGFWPGPAACSGAQELTTSAEGLLGELDKVQVVRCDQPEWHFLGLSFAGWNAVVCFVLFIGTLKAAFAAVGRN